MKTNILVQYRGGGYAGCIWEWNYFYIDKQKKFHNIASSGCAGIDNLQDAKKLIKNEPDDLYIYDMGKDEDIAIFSKESNAIYITGVFQFFDDNIDELGIEFFVICGECGNQIRCYDDMILQQDILLCNECFSIGYCPCCESYVGETEMVGVKSDEHSGFDFICSDCKIYHDEQRETENLEDLRFESFCIGKPDMFSDELRQVWT